MAAGDYYKIPDVFMPGTPPRKLTEAKRVRGVPVEDAIPPTDFQLVFLASIQITSTGFKKRLSCCGPRCDMLISGITSCVALLGAAISLIISTAGLFTGPYCLYQHDNGVKQNWGYPKHNILRNSSMVIVPDPSLKSFACIEPPHIETWHSSFFILLSMSNLLQILLCLSQIVNAIFGVLCGHCDQEKKGRQMDG